jgi:hypothetical protein
MNFLYFFLLVLGLSIADDIICVFYLRRVVDGDIVQGALFSMGLGTVQLIGTNFFIESRWYGLAVVLGNGIGTAVAIWYEKTHPAKKPRDKKTGRFKPPVSPASFQLGEEKRNI